MSVIQRTTVSAVVVSGVLLVPILTGLPRGVATLAAQTRIDPLSVYTLCVTAAYAEVAPRLSNAIEAFVRAQSACERVRARLDSDLRRTAGPAAERALLGIDVTLLRTLGGDLLVQAGGTRGPVDQPGVRMPAMTGLPLQSCSLERNLQSRDGAQAVRLEFVNAAPEPRYVFWLDYEGKRTAYGVLAPGQSRVQDTYASHPWVVTDSTGTCRALIVAGRSGRVVVE